jgi:hypothetical protein
MLLDEVVDVPAARWRSYDIELRQRPAAIECSYEVVSGNAAVRVILTQQPDQEGTRPRALEATEYEKSGGFRYGPGQLGFYSLVVDNQREGSGPARVHLVASLAFVGMPQDVVPPQRRLVVILVTVALMAALVAFAASRLKGAVLGRPPEETQ